MTSITSPSHSKSLTLSTSHTYTYIHHPPRNPSHPTTTFLFLHGFPSSSYDWRHQIAFFISQGHGVLAPDLLGYGGSSKPVSLDAYRARSMAAEIVEILDHEGLDQVHAVGHDMGCGLLSRLADYYPTRLKSCVFLDVPYTNPGARFDLDMVNAMSREVLGYERFGYLSFFARKESAGLLDRFGESFFTLFYPHDPELWISHLGPTGAMEAWLCGDSRAPLASWITEEEKTTHHQIMQDNHSFALNWYQALVSNINVEDELRAGLEPTLEMPVLMISPQRSRLEFPGVEESMGLVARDLTFKRVSKKGHWLQLEARDEVNGILGEFVNRVDGVEG
ncbi:alpha/beta hydrolase [Aspergillus affinis]|uniref:alpha/beta hydrolase n=1 Tax=Aspergillus affinis TaxID=1070780 RepID=UPI0022FEBE0F|nr:putative epoxide hydrolase [Aspergillus affinis]KAI9037438.1 putative epoxide hydrolase [Aspergillus affinis]